MIKLVSFAQMTQPTPSFQVLSSQEVRDADFVNAWRELSEEAIVPNPFFDPDFCLPAIAKLTNGKVQIAVIYDDGLLVALTPFVVNRYAHLGPKVVELWTHDYIPLGTPLVKKGEPQALEALLTNLTIKYNAPILSGLFKGIDQFGISSNELVVDMVSQHQRAAMITKLDAVSYRESTLSKQRRPC